MIAWSLGGSIQWFVRLKILDMFHILTLTYCHMVLPFSGGFLDIMWHLDSIPAFCDMSLILVIKDLEQYYELNMILGELLFTITLGDIQDTIVSQIGVKGNILILRLSTFFHCGIIWFNITKWKWSVNITDDLIW